MKRALLLFALLVVAGCVAPADPGATHTSSSTRSANTVMTAEASHTDSSMPCVDGVNGNHLPEVFCAVRTLTVEGQMSGIARLPVSLSTGSGSAKVEKGVEGTWSLVATITAHGSTPDAATANLENAGFTWSHEDAGEHHVIARTQQNASTSRISVSLVLRLPPSVVQELRVETGSGSVDVADVATDGLVLTTGSGKLDVRATLTRATLRAGSGSITATLSPSASGAIDVTTGSGHIALALPEDAAHGYALGVSTGSGSIDIGLRDGTASACPEKGSCHHREFKTSGYDQRDLRGEVTVSAGSGDVSVKAA